MRYNKKGISAVVATVLIILITVAAVTIIWAAIIPLIQENLGSTTACLSAQTEIILDSDFTCIKKGAAGGNTSDYVNLQVKAGPSDVGLSDIQVILYAGGNTNSTTVANPTFNLNPSSRAMPTSNSAKVYTLTNVSVTGTGSPESSSKILNGTIDKIQIAPVVTEGNTPQTCTPGQVITLKPCA